MAENEKQPDNLNLLGLLDHYVGFHRVQDNWLSIFTLTIFPILGFSLIAGFLAGISAFYQCFFGAILIVLGLLTFSLIITFVNERFQGVNQKAAQLEKSIAELDSVLLPFLDSIKQFESRLTELMAILPKEAAITYQKSKSLSAALLIRKDAIVKFKENEGAEGIEAALELLKLPIDFKFDSLSSVSGDAVPKSIKAEDWQGSIEELHLELKQYLSRR